VETDLQAQYPEMLYSNLLAKVHEVLEERLKALSDTNPALGGATGSTLAGDPSEPALSSSTAGETSKDGASTSGEEETPDTHKLFGSSIPNWPIFPDTCDALRRLSKYFKLVVLSNVDRDSFRHTHALLSEGPTRDTLTSALDVYTCPDPNPNRFWHPQATPGSQSPFALILTAQDTGCYKPALGGFLTALDYIKSQQDLFGDVANREEVREKVLSVAQSLPHDHEPASEIGMRSVWIDRQSAVTCNETPGGPGAKAKWTWRFETLGEMADAVEKEVTEGG